MNEKGWLLCQVKEKRANNRVLIMSTLEDDTSFVVEVSGYSITEIDNVAGNWAWLEIEHSGERNGRVGITLPQAVLSLGSRMTVKLNRIRYDDPKRGSADANVRYVLKNLKEMHPNEFAEVAETTKEIVKAEVKEAEEKSMLE